jgi:hypothetical protein
MITEIYSTLAGHLTVFQGIEKLQMPLTNTDGAPELDRGCSTAYIRASKPGTLQETADTLIKAGRVLTKINTMSRTRMYKGQRESTFREHRLDLLLRKRTIALATTERHVKLSTRDKDRTVKVRRVRTGTGGQELRQCGWLADRMRVLCCLDLVRRGFEERVDVCEDVREGDVAGV